MRSRYYLGGVLVTAALLVACRRTAPPVMPYDFSNGEDVVRAMHDRYANRWFETLVYVQHNQPVAGGPESVWLIAVRPPARMRIDFEPRERGNGMLAVRDTEYVVTAARPTQIFRLIHPAMLLQHDVYVYPAEETILRLREVGFDLSRARSENWNGRDMLVVGTAGQEFWVDRQYMLLARLIQPSRGGPRESRYLDYEKLGPSWVPRRIETYSGPTLTDTHELRQIRSNISLDSLLFRPDNWVEVRHWYQTPVLRR